MTPEVLRPLRKMNAFLRYPKYLIHAVKSALVMYHKICLCNLKTQPGNCFTIKTAVVNVKCFMIEGNAVVLRIFI